MSCLTAFVDLLQQMRFDRLPPPAVEQAKACIADYLSIFAFGKTMPPASALKEALGGEQIAAHAEDLALWMGGAARLLDLDDGHRFAMGHPGVPILSAAFASAAAAAEETGGELFLTAVVRAYETYCYLGRCINPSAYLERGFDATCVCGAPAAAAACGTLHRLNRRQLADAISIAASLCGGLNQYVEDGSSPKYLCAGWAAKLGIAAVKLAENGMTGPEEIFEGRLGFCHGFSPNPDGDYLRNPRLNWEINHVYLKKFSCVRRIHATLDCIEEFLSETGTDYHSIQKLCVYGGRFLASAGTYAPGTEVKAQTSVPYTVALLLRYGEVTLARIADNLRNPEVEALSGKVHVIEDEAFNRLTEREPSLWGAVRVEIVTADGAVHTKESHVANGDPEKPFSKEALKKKFMTLVQGVWDDATAERAWESVQAMEKEQVDTLLLLNI